MKHDCELDQIINNFNHEQPLPKRIKEKKQALLLKLPLFTIIYQKKGEENFSLIVNKIKLQRFSFGDSIIDMRCNEERFFYYIVRGSVVMFTTKKQSSGHSGHSKPQLYKKLEPNQYFGEKLIYGNDSLHQVKALSTCYLLSLDISTFYNAFAGHFQYVELKDKINFLQSIWIFSSIPRSVIQKILLISEITKIKKNTILIRKNQVPQHFYIILSGQLALFQEYKQSKIKYLPFCLLSRSELCGLDQIILDKPYQYNGVITSQFLEVLILSKEVYQTYMRSLVIQKDKTVKRNYMSKVSLMGNSFNYEDNFKKLNKAHLDMQKTMKQANMAQLISSNRHTKVEMEKVELNHVQELKNSLIRQVRLKDIRQAQVKEYSEGGIAFLTNNNYTKDKKLLINYLEKKQRPHRKAAERQMSYQKRSHSVSGVMPEIRIRKSPAVKNHKRKLVKSRCYNNSCSFIQNPNH